jgi:hypothetical protein
MRTVGIATTVVIALAILTFLAVMVISLPDLARYLRLRRM